MILFWLREKSCDADDPANNVKYWERGRIMANRGVVRVGLGEGKKLPVKHPAAAEITMLIDGATAGSKYLSENITRVKPGVTLKPAHSHKDIEEIVYVLKGEGQMWAEGSTLKIKQGDSIFFPAGSMHTVRNTGSDILELLCFFSSPQYRKEGAYLTHETDVF